MKNHRKWIHRIVAVVLATLIILTSILTYGARAQSSLSIQASASPDAISEPDTVTITVNLENDSAYAMHAVTITGNGVSEDVGGLAQGESKQVSFSYSVNEYELNDGVPLKVEWVENEEVASSSTTVSIEKKKKSEPKILLKRSIDKTDVQVGDSVTITYTVTNTGEVSLRSITVTDEGVSDDPIEEGFRLDVGASKEITKKVTIGTEGITSKANVTAKDSDGQRTSDSTSSQIITATEATEPKVSLVASPSGKTEEGIPIQVTVKNEGNTPIEKITIQDDVGVILADGETLDIDETKTFQTIADVMQARQVVISFTGQPVGEESPLTMTSAPIPIEPQYKSDDLKVTVEVIPKTSTMDEAGDLPVQVILNNTSGLTLKSVELHEAVRGKLKSLADLPPGITMLDDIVVSVLDSSPLQFFIQGNNPVGEPLKFEASPVNITVYNPATATGQEVEEVAAIEPEETNSNMWLIAMLALILILVVLIVALIVVLVKEYKLKREMKDSDEYDEIDDIVEIEEDIRPVRRASQRQEREIVEDDLEVIESHPQRKQTSPQPQRPQQRQEKPSQSEERPTQQSSQQQAKPVQEKTERSVRPRNQRSPLQRQQQERKKIVVKNERQRILDLSMGEEPEALHSAEGDQLHLIDDQPVRQPRKQRPVQGANKQTNVAPFEQQAPAAKSFDKEPIQEKPSKKVPESVYLDEEDLFAYEFLGEEPDPAKEEQRLFEQAFLSDDDKEKE